MDQGQICLQMDQVLDWFWSVLGFNLIIIELGMNE